MTATMTIDELVTQLETAHTVIETLGPAVIAKCSADLVALAQPLCPVDTAATRNSIHTTVIGPYVSVTGPTTWYAPFLEFGTSRMAPRPFMGPATTLIEPGFAKAAAQLGVAPFLRGQGGYTATSPQGATYTSYGPLGG